MDANPRIKGLYERHKEKGSVCMVVMALLIEKKALVAHAE